MAFSVAQATACLRLEFILALPNWCPEWTDALLEPGSFCQGGKRCRALHLQYIPYEVDKLASAFDGSSTSSILCDVDSMCRDRQPVHS